MKLSLPGIIKRIKAAGGEAEPKPMPEVTDSMKPASLARVRLLLLVTGVTALVVLGYFVFQLMSLHVASTMDRENAVTTDLVAARVSALVEYYGTSLALQARDDELADLLIKDHAAKRSAREESLRHVYPGAVNVRLLEPGLDQVDMEASPPLSYAALAQMRTAEGGKQAPVEVHLLNTPQKHINIVRAVMAPGNDGGVVGHIMLSLSHEVLRNTLGDLQDIHGYLELQQNGAKGQPAVIAARGDVDIKSGNPGWVVPVSGSRWQVAYWPATSSLAYLGKAGVWVLAATLVSAMVLVVMVVLLFRRLNNAIRLGEVSLVSLMKDYRDGRVRRDYPVGLTEMTDTLEFMIQLAAGTQDAVKARKQVTQQQGGNGAQQEVADNQPAETEDKTDSGSDNQQAPVPAESPIKESGALNIEDENITVDASIFRAYDIRGVVDQTLTVPAVRLIGRAIGSEALQRGRDTVVVGRDGRLSGPVLSQALIEGMLETGCNVKDIGVVPTPVLYFATHYLDTQTGVVVTGSHNPPDYNGLKIVIDGETLSGQSIQALRERIETRNFISGQGSIDNLSVVPDYIERIRGDISLARPLKVVVDCGNGVAGGVAPELLRTLGCEVTELFCEVDGNFPNHHPDPSKAENLKDLIAAVSANQADIGLAFDGDGDRLGVVTSAGDIIWPDRVLMLYAIDILERNPGGQIIYDVKCTRFLDSIIREHGGEPLMWKTGHSFIKAKIKESGALLAGEMSGHIFIKERWYGFDDGIYAAARLLEILSKDARSSSDIFAGLPDSVNTPEINVAMQEGEPQVFIGRLLENAHFDAAKISTIDGLRADFEDGWGLVRASNTTPVLVLRFEADNEDALNRIMGEFRRVMTQVDAGLELPF
jgi:phosphomannomutase/phosphoglucomutase